MPATAPRPGLTPHQRRTIRTHLALIPVYVWLAYVWPVFFAQLPVSTRADQTHLVRDFLHFYTQGLITREHDVRALYDINAMAAVADRVVPGVPKAVFPPVYPPQVSLFFSPLARLSYLPALYAWLGVTLVGFAACTFVVWRQSDLPRDSAWPVAALALGAPGLHFTLSFAQASVLGLSGFTALWLALKRGHLFTAGLAIGVLAYKPQLGIVAAFVFLLRREWRVVAGATTSIALQFLAAWAYWGGSVFQGYVRALWNLSSVFDAMEPNKDVAYSIRSVFLALSLSPRTALALSLVVSGVVIGAAVAAWRPAVPMARRYAGLVFASLLVDPHLYGYDLVLAVPAMVLAGGWAVRQREELLLAGLILVYIGPILTMIASLPAAMTTIGLAATTACILGRSGKNVDVWRQSKSGSAD